jgi:hypothetical protein
VHDHNRPSRLARGPCLQTWRRLVPGAGRGLELVASSRAAKVRAFVGVVAATVPTGFEEDVLALGGPGGDLLSQVLRHSTIGAEAFDGRVRDGIGSDRSAKATRPAKGEDVKQTGGGRAGSTCEPALAFSKIAPCFCAAPFPCGIAPRRSDPSRGRTPPFMRRPALSARRLRACQDAKHRLRRREPWLASLTAANRSPRSPPFR